jgi:hypothetical protein
MRHVLAFISAEKWGFWLLLAAAVLTASAPGRARAETSVFAAEITANQGIAFGQYDRVGFMGSEVLLKVKLQDIMPWQLVHYGPHDMAVVL